MALITDALENLTDEELRAKHDEHVRNTGAQGSGYLDALRHRESSRSSKKLERWTIMIAFLTVCILGLTIAAVALAAS